MVRTLFRAFMLIATVLVLQGCAAVFQRSTCENPRAPGGVGSPIKIVILPISYSGANLGSVNAEHTLAGINSFATLRAVTFGAEISDVGVALLRNGEGGCDVEDVYKKLVKARLSYAAVILFWGNIYDVSDHLVIETRTRLLWGNLDKNEIVVSKSIRQRDSGQSSRRFEFKGALPVSTIAFPPRALSANELVQTGERGRNFARLSKSASAEAFPLPLSFEVGTAEGKWLPIKDLTSKQTLWVDRDEIHSTATFPELSYTNALAAYVHFQHYGASSPEDWNSLASRLEEYESKGRDMPGSDPSANASLLKTAFLLQRDTDSDELEAIVLLDRLVAQFPLVSEILNLAALARINTCCSTREESMKVLNLLERATDLEPGSERYSRNLLNFYQLAQSLAPHLRPLEYDELAARASKLQTKLD